MSDATGRSRGLLSRHRTQEPQMGARKDVPEPPQGEPGVMTYAKLLAIIDSFADHQSWRCEHYPGFYYAELPESLANGKDCPCGLVAAKRDAGLPTDWPPPPPLVEMPSDDDRCGDCRALKIMCRCESDPGTNRVQN